MSDTACATCMQPYWDCRCAPAAKEPTTVLCIDDTPYNMRAAKEPGVRSCTCHPDDNPPQPCPQKYALTDCRMAALAAQVEGVTATLIREREFRQQEWLSLHAIINQTKMERDKLTAENAAMRELLAMDEPWPLIDVLNKMVDAVDHLLVCHACDVHGHEEYAAAYKQAKIASRRIDALLASKAGEKP